MNRSRPSFISLPSIARMLGSGPDAEHPKGAHLRRSRTSQPMRSPHPGGGTEKLPMTEPARTEMQLMRASCWRKTATCPMRGCEQQVWKAERPLSSGAGLCARANARARILGVVRSPPAMARAARLLAALAALLAAAATGGDARPSKIGAGRTGLGSELGRAAREKGSQRTAAGWGMGKAAGRGRGPEERTWMEKGRGSATGRGRGPQ